MQNQVSDYIKKIKEKVDVQHGYRLGTVFASKHKKYAYDTGTGKVFECNEPEYKILGELLENGELPGILDGFTKLNLQRPIVTYGKKSVMRIFYRYQDTNLLYVNQMRRWQTCFITICSR